MSTTPNVEVNFEEQISDLCRCFKYFNIYSITGTDRANIYTKNSDNSRTPHTVKRKHSIIADTTAEFVTKDKLKLYPATIEFNFIHEDDESKNILVSLPLASELIVKHEPGVAELDAWYQTAGLQRFELSDDLGLRQLQFQNKWKAYYPVGSSDSEGEFIYVHFEEVDSWVAFRFESVSNDTQILQILNYDSSFIVSDDEMKFHFTLTSNFVDIDNTNRYSFLSDYSEELGKKKFFDLSKLYYAAEDQVDSFKHEQEDPYIDPDLLEEQELEFLCGSKENLEKMLTLICHAAIPMHLWDRHPTLEINVRSAMDNGDGAEIDYDNMRYDSSWGEVRDANPSLADHIESAFETALSENTPTGYSWEYNDGPYDRKSGYDRSPKRLDITISAPSAHEQIGAKMEIKQFASLLGKATIAGLLNQKEV